MYSEFQLNFHHNRLSSQNNDKIRLLQKNNCVFDPHSSPNPETSLQNVGTRTSIQVLHNTDYNTIYNTVNTRIAGLQVFMADYHRVGRLYK